MTDFITDTQSYLQSYFQPTNTHAAACELSEDELEQLIASGTYPNASYQVQHHFQCTSFVADKKQHTNQAWHRSSHQNWHQALKQNHIKTETQAFELFTSTYLEAHQVHFNGPLGQAMQHFWPALATLPADDYLNASWSYFQQGVYGVCTRDGLPETIFKKQCGVKFIDHLMAQQAQFSNVEIEQILQIIGWLDHAAAPFAPHEVATSSRQRCIINARIHFHQLLTADNISR